jgi:hypothetical protein
MPASVRGRAGTPLGVSAPAPPASLVLDPVSA